MPAREVLEHSGGHEYFGSWTNRALISECGATNVVERKGPSVWLVQYGEFTSSQYRTQIASPRIDVYTTMCACKCSAMYTDKILLMIEIFVPNPILGRSVFRARISRGIKMNYCRKRMRTLQHCRAHLCCIVSVAESLSLLLCCTVVLFAARTTRSCMQLGALGAPSPQPCAQVRVSRSIRLVCFVRALERVLSNGEMLMLLRLETAVEGAQSVNSDANNVSGKKIVASCPFTVVPLFPWTFPQFQRRNVLI